MQEQSRALTLLTHEQASHVSPQSRPTSQTPAQVFFFQFIPPGRHHPEYCILPCFDFAPLASGPEVWETALLHPSYTGIVP